MTARVVLFDLYRTLIYIVLEEQDPEVWRAISLYLRYRGVRVAPEALMLRFFAAIEEDFQRRLAVEPHPEIDIVEVFEGVLEKAGVGAGRDLTLDLLRLFRTLCRRDFGVFEEVHATLAELGGHHRLGLISNAHRVFAEPELAMAGLDSVWDLILISSDHGVAKPSPRLFQYALERLGARPEEAIYVGDNPAHDIVGARAAGIRAVHLNRDGQSYPDGVPPPDYTISSLHQLPGLLV